MQCSSSTVVVVSLAEREARAAAFAEIQPEHLLAAALKLAELSQIEIQRLASDQAASAAMTSEIGQLVSMLRDRGIAWNTRKPFASSTRLTRKRLLATMPDGSTQVLIDAGASPGMAAVNALLMALVAGDLDALATRFTLKETLRADGGWSLALQPRDAALKQAFTRIVLDGDRYVRGVEIIEPAGDRTRIVFSDLRETPPATRQEAAQLD